MLFFGRQQPEKRLSAFGTLISVGQRHNLSQQCFYLLNFKAILCFNSLLYCTVQVRQRLKGHDYLYPPNNQHTASWLEKGSFRFEHALVGSTFDSQVYFGSCMSDPLGPVLPGFKDPNVRSAVSRPLLLSSPTHKIHFWSVSGTSKKKILSQSGHQIFDVISYITNFFWKGVNVCNILDSLAHVTFKGLIIQILINS